MVRGDFAHLFFFFLSTSEDEGSVKQEAVFWTSVELWLAVVWFCQLIM